MITPPLNSENNYDKELFDYSKVTLPEWAIPHHVPTNHPYWLYGHYQDYHERTIRRMKTQYKEALNPDGTVNDRLFRMFFGHDTPEGILYKIDKLVKELDEFTLKYPDATFNYDNT